jgi:hypothetical protein
MVLVRLKRIYLFVEAVALHLLHSEAVMSDYFADFGWIL